MRTKKYVNLLLALLLMWSNVAIGQNGFDPTPPGDPNSPPEKAKVIALASPTFGGTVEGTGRYVVGSNVTLSAQPATGFTFTGWVNEQGQVVCQTRSFTFTKAHGTQVYTANFEFNPGGPSEPGDPAALLYYQLTVKAAAGGTAYGGGKYRANTSVHLSASANPGFAFAYWKNEEGDVLSRNSSFDYITKAKKETIIAVFTYEPDAPAEPNEPILRHKVTLRGSMGVVPAPSGRGLEGSSFHVSCSLNPGYKFLYWMKDGEEYTQLKEFDWAIGKEDVEFYAVAVFDPDAPADPPMPALDLYSYYLMTVNGKPGDIVNYPIYLNNTEIVKDMYIRLTFPAGMEVDVNDYALSDKAVGYTVTISEAQDDYSIIEEGAKLWDFTIIGGNTNPGTQALLTFKVKIPDNMSTGGKHQVKINQISMVQEDGTPVTAHTRNGRIGVYKMGDVNGDDTVNITDVLGTLSIIKGDEDDTLIREVADPNDDGNVNITDVLGVLEIIKNNNAND